MSLQKNRALAFIGNKAALTAFLAIVTAAAFAIACPTAAHAHPPGEVSLAYDAQSGVLSVTITHSSIFPAMHYIKTVDITVNGKSVTGSTYTKQPAGNTFTYTYPIPASSGDEISVTISCNMFGSKAVKYMVMK